MSEKECLCTTPEYTIELNQQGPPGIQGEPGADGFSPSITVAQQDTYNYILTILTKDGQFNTPNLQGAGVPSGGVPGQILYKDSGNNYATTWGDFPIADNNQSGIIRIAGVEDLELMSTDTAVNPAQLITRTPQASATQSGMVKPNDPLYIDPDNDGELYIRQASVGQQGTVQYGPEQADVTNMRFLGLDDNRPGTGEAKLNGVWLPPALSNMLGGVKANSRQDTDTQEVRIDTATGMLYTAPGLPETIDGGNAQGGN